MKRRLPVLWPRFGLWAAVALLLLIAILAGLHAGARVRAACELPAVEKAAFLLVHQLERFDHSYQFATSAAPDTIVRPLAELQQILMDTQQVEVPGCLETAKGELLAYMGTVMKAFLAYGARNEDTLRALLAQSDTHYEEFHIELEEVQACAPWCLR